MTDPRLSELDRSLQRLNERLAAACSSVGRDRSSVRVIAVSKTFPASDVLRLASLGHRDFGESYDQEAAAKAGALADAGVGVSWHFVGRVQRNKCRSIAAYAAVVHAVDRAEVVDALAAGARRLDRTVDVLLQLSADGDPRRGGAAAADLPALADRVATCPELRLRGLMVVAPLGRPARPVFAAAESLRGRLARRHPSATELSAGMSGDLDDAVAEGATLLRIGTALFGGRNAAVR